jgi:hypothetical protein
MGHVVHKHLVAKLLNGGDAHDRFMQKISQYDATLDREDGGGIGVENIIDDGDEEAQAVDHPAIQPECIEDGLPCTEPWPVLFSQSRNTGKSSTITSGMSRMSLAGSEADTVVASAAPTQSSNRYVHMSVSKWYPYSIRPVVGVPFRYSWVNTVPLNPLQGLHTACLLRPQPGASTCYPAPRCGKLTDIS